VVAQVHQVQVELLVLQEQVVAQVHLVLQGLQDLAEQVVAQVHLVHQEQVDSLQVVSITWRIQHLKVETLDLEKFYGIT
jgi:hypothetical protein